jgi:hypothetical protein
MPHLEIGIIVPCALLTPLAGIARNRLLENWRTSAMLMEAKAPTQAQSFSPSRTKLTPIIVALTAIILLVLTSAAFAPGLLPSTYPVEEASLIGP